MASSTCGPASDRDDARVVDHLVQEHDVVGRLDDLVVGVVAGEQVRHPERDAALLQPPVGPGRSGVVGEMGDPCVDLPLRLRREGRQPSVRGIDDQRGPIVELAVDQPELVVVAGGRVARREVVRIAEGGDEDAVGERRVALAAGEELRVARLQPGQLLVGQGGLVAQDLRTLQRRGGVVGPHALQVGPSVRRARHGPLLLLRPARRRNHRHRQGDCAAHHAAHGS